MRKSGWFAFALTAASALSPPAMVQAQSQAASMAELKNEVALLKEKVQELEITNKQLESLDQRVRILDRRLEVQQDDAREMAKTRPVIDAGSQGFIIHSQDNDYSLRVGGYMQADGRFYTTDTKPSGNGSTFLIRRLRPFLEGTVAKYYDFRFMTDFGQGATTLQDAYADVHYIPELQVRAGKFKEPVGLERLQDDRNIRFVERALPTALVPDRDIGFDFHGSLFGQRVEYALGAFNGTPDNTATVDNDNNDAKDFAGRLYFHPFAGTPLEFAQKLGVGIAGTFGDQRSTTLDTYKTAGGTTFFTFNKGVTASGPRFRYSPQFDYYWGPLGILGEYVDNTQQLRLTRTITVGSGKGAKTELVNFPRQTISNQAWQIAGAYLLTGEDNTYGAVKPRHDFEPFGGGLGAWELVARLDQLLIDRAAFDGKYSYGSPASSAREAFEWAVGLNWYLNRNVKLQTDYSRTSFTWGKSSSHNLPNESVVLSELQLQF